MLGPYPIGSMQINGAPAAAGAPVLQAAAEAAALEGKSGVDPVLLALDVLGDVNVAQRLELARRDARVLARRVRAVHHDENAAIGQALGRGLQKRMWPVYERAIAKHFARHYSEEQAAALAELLRPLVPARP